MRVEGADDDFQGRRYKKLALNLICNAKIGVGSKSRDGLLSFPFLFVKVRLLLFPWVGLSWWKGRLRVEGEEATAGSSGGGRRRVLGLPGGCAWPCLSTASRAVDC